MLGLKNLGNTCYLNSAIQLVLHSYRIKMYLERPITRDSTFLSELKQLLLSTTSVAPDFIRNYMCAKYEQFKGFYQYDAHEFLSYLLQEIGAHFEFLGTRFTVTYFSEMHVLSCQCGQHSQYRYTNSQLLLDITVSWVAKLHSRFFVAPGLSNALVQRALKVPGNSLTTLLQEWHRAVVCQQKCRHCYKRLSQTLILKSLPYQLIIVIKRFSSDGQKIIAKVYFDEFLNFAQINAKKGVFKLNAVIMHTGTIEQGHYTCCCKTGNYWQEYSDDHIYNIDMDFQDSRAYILSYEQI